MAHAVFKITPHVGLVEVGLARFDESLKFTGTVGESIFLTSEEAWRMARAAKCLIDHNFDEFIASSPRIKSGYGSGISEESPFGIMMTPMEKELGLLNAYDKGQNIEWDETRTIAAVTTATPSIKEKGKIATCMVTLNEAALYRFATRMIQAASESDALALYNGFPSTYEEALEALEEALEDENDLE